MDGATLQWIKLARVSDLVDRVIKPCPRVEARVAIVTVDGVVFAFDDYCSHAWCTFTPGNVEENGEVLCRCHDAKFSYVTGAVIWGPTDNPIRTFPVRVEGDDIYVEMEVLPD